MSTSTIIDSYHLIERSGNSTPSHVHCAMEKEACPTFNKQTTTRAFERTRGSSKALPGEPGALQGHLSDPEESSECPGDLGQRQFPSGIHHYDDDLMVEVVMLGIQNDRGTRKVATADTNSMGSPPGASMISNLGVDKITAAEVWGECQA
jgi:hypothetical protein